MGDLGCFFLLQHWVIGVELQAPNSGPRSFRGAQAVFGEEVL